MSVLQWIGNGEAIAHIMAGMPSWCLLAILALCIMMLTKGADYMITGAVSLARQTKLPEVIIGATIISLGTTMPEMCVSVLAAWTGNPGLALGNGVGSIICDTGMILGLTCILARVPVNRFILNRAGFVQVGAATLVVLLSLRARLIAPEAPILQRWVGVLLLALLVGYLYLSYRWAQQDDSQAEENGETGPTGLPKTLAFILGGLAAVIAGSRFLVPCVAEGAFRIGVPQDVVAATLVAFGTSLPELTTAVIAVRKGHPQIMVGNIVGADVLNCLFVIGAATVASPLHVPPNFFVFHFPAMLLILYSFRFFIYVNKDGWFKRVQGMWILGIYVGYLVLQYRFNMGA